MVQIYNQLLQYCNYGQNFKVRASNALYNHYQTRLWFFNYHLSYYVPDKMWIKS